MLEGGYSSYVVGNLWSFVSAGRSTDTGLAATLDVNWVFTDEVEVDDLYMQVGFGLYPVIVKLFAAEKKANPIIFSFYRQVLIHTQSSAHNPGLISQPLITVGLASQSEPSKHTGVLCSRHLFSRFIQRCLLFPGTVSLCLCCWAQDPYTQPKNAYCKSKFGPAQEI